MDYELALIDMDGTVYEGDRPVEGVNKALNFLEENDVDIFFLTNYAGRRRESYSERLDEMGIDASSDQVVTSGWLTARYIQQNLPDAEVFVLGEDDLEAELRDEEITVMENCDDPDIVVVSDKHDLDYEDLKQVLQGVNKETILLGTNPDETLPVEDGEVPAAGTILKAVETMTDKEAEIIGKPTDNAVTTVTELADVDSRNCIMIGDKLNIDILMGNRNGMETVLVLSGVTDREDIEVSENSADHVVESIADLEKVF